MHDSRSDSGEGRPSPVPPFSNLFSPIKIGNLQLKNRLVMSPMATNFATEDGRPVQHQIEYYAERARGGVGLIVCESSYISPEGKNAVKRLGLYTDDMVKDHRRLVDAVHKENTPIFAQISHGGRASPVNVIGQYPVSASAVPLLVRGEHYVGVIARSLSVSEIHGLVDLFATTAVRALQAGYDGVQVHSAHGYLLHQFLSPLTNKRSDLYGGSEENRARFLLEVVRRIREVIGPEKPLTVRLTGQERTEGGYKPDYIRRVATWLEEAGVSEINISSGSSEEYEWTIAHRMMDEGYNVPVAALVKASVGVPVSVVGRIKRPALADRIIAEGQADLVYMGRALIADPGMPEKARLGKLEEIRECLSCNSCVGRIHVGPEMECTVNPEAGLPEAERRLVPAKKTRRVLVVGGGPAGLEVARVAASRGHEVTLAEQTDRLGGQLLLAAAAPRSEEMSRLAQYLARRAKAAGVTIRTRTQVTPELVEQSGAEVVVIATGARPVVPEIPGSALPQVLTPPDILGSNPNPGIGQRVAIIGGGLTGVDVALLLIERGHLITLIEAMDSLMPDSNIYEKKVLTQALGEHGATVLVKTRAEAITREGVVVTRGGRRETIGADTVVMAVGVRSYRGPLAHIDSSRVDVHVVGDAQSPRRIMDALREGASIGRMI